MTDYRDGSVLLSMLRRAVRDSRVVGAVRRVRTRLGSGVERSRSGGAVDRLGSTLGDWVRGSWLYSWLTAEPDPEIIVIDLRETYTVGPVIAALDRLARWVGPRWRGSRPARLLDRASTTVATACEDSVAVRLLTVLLVPPELEDDGLDGAERPEEE